MSALLILACTGVASIFAALSITGIVLFRTRAHALAYWLFGWGALMASALTTLIAPQYAASEPFTPLFATLLSPLMLLGALAHTNRPRPAWILALAGAIGVLRAVATEADLDRFSVALSMASEPAFAFGGAWVLLNPYLVVPRPVERSDRILALGFVLLGCMELFDAATKANGTFGSWNMIAWLALAMPLLTAQVGFHLAGADRDRRRDADEFLALGDRLDLIFRAASECLAEIDERGVIEWVGASATVAGAPPAASLIGRNVVEFLDPESESFIRSRISAKGRLDDADVAAAAGTTHLVCLPDGSRRWFEFLGAVRHTASGALRIVARLRDVTDRVERDQTLHRSEARMLRSERIAGVGSWEADLSSRQFVFSPEMYRIYGLDPEIRVFSFEKVAELTHEEDRVFAWDLWRQVIDGGESREVTHRIVRPSDGTVRTVRMVLETERNEAGRVVRLVGSSIDVTEQVALTSRLRQDQKRLQALIDSDFVSVFVAERAGAITEANEAFLARLGYSKEDLPLDWRELTAPEDRAADDGRIARGISPGRYSPFEKSFVSVSGERVPMMLACAPFARDASIIVGTDLSDLKRAEADRARYQQELEQTVAARTRELRESRSRLAKHERLASIGTLAAGVAHQINNPVGAIANCAEYALLCRDDADAQDVFERALRDNLAEARRCGQIVRSMLQFSRDQPTTKWIEDLNRVARRAHRAIETYAKDRGATIRFEAGDDPLLVRISPIEVEQAIVNVVRNAIESRDGEVQVSIVVSRRDKSAIIEITDDGHGIRPEHHEHLFEPFFSTRTREGGTGLGLSVAHGVFVDHGGTIQVDSSPSRGTRVVMSLPLEQVVVDVEEVASPRRSPASRNLDERPDEATRRPTPARDPIPVRNPIAARDWSEDLSSSIDAPS